MFRFVVIFCAAVALAKGNTTQVSQCINNQGALPFNTYIEGCITPPCSLPQLQDAVINIQFAPSHDAQSMRTLATAYLLVGIINIPVPYDLGENSVTCNFLTNASCPVRGGQELNYTLRMPIEPIFLVGTQVTVEFRVVDDTNIFTRSFLCIRVPIRIVDPIE